MNATTPSSSPQETAVLGGGCFWCLEAVFDELAGVRSVESGYAGGRNPDPTYDDVCSGRTGHAEVVRVTFDPSVLSFRDLLTVFFTIHDPTTQGPAGQRRRYAIPFGRSSANRRNSAPPRSRCARSSRPGSYGRTRSSPRSPALRRSTRRSATTRNTIARNPAQPYCAVVVAPKVAKFRKHFTERLKRKA